MDEKNISKLSQKARFSQHVPLIFRWAPEGEEGEASSHQAQTEDISVGGLRFLTELPLREGDLLQLELHFPERELALEGRVVLVRPEAGQEGQTSVGVEFQGQGADIQEELRGLIVPRLSLRAEDEETDEEG